MHTSFAEEDVEEISEASDLLRTLEGVADRLGALALSNAGRYEVRANLSRFMDARDRVSGTIDSVRGV